MKVPRSVWRFLLVGGTAAAVHEAVVLALVEAGWLLPWQANLPAFALAWCVSYTGHRSLTFASDRPHREALPRFLGVSLLGLALNQALYVALLRWTPLHYAVALFITLAAVAVLTYVLARAWAFAHPVNGVRP